MIVTDRRTFLAALAATAVSLPFAGRAETGAAAAILRYGDFYVVEGWVLTRDDVKALGLHAR